LLVQKKRADFCRRDGNRLMAGKNGQSAPLQVGADYVREPLIRLRIQRHEGFIQYPQGAFFQRQAGEGDAPLLSLREITTGQFYPSGKPDLFQRVQRDILVYGFVVEAGRGHEVFQRGQIFLDRVLVAEIAEIAAKTLLQTLDVFALPANFPGDGQGKTAENAEHTGFSRAVLALQKQEFAAFKAKIYAVKKALVAALTFDLDGFEHGTGKEERGGILT